MNTTFEERKKSAIRALEQALRKQDAAKAEGRQLTDDERLQVGLAQAEAARFTDDAKHGDVTLPPGKRLTDSDPRPGSGGGERDRYRANGDDPHVRHFRGVDGTEQVIFRNTTPSISRYYRERAAERDGETERPDLGNVLAAKVTRKTHHCTDADMKAIREMSSLTNTSGGFAVSEELGAQLYDVARPESTFLTYASTLPMNAGETRLVLVTEDVAYTVASDNELITEDQPALGAHTLFPWTLATYVKMPRQLADDSPMNFREQLMSFLGRSLAQALDRMGWAGVGTTEPLGVMNKPGVNSTGSIGSIVWTDLVTARSTVLAANGPAEAYVIPPAIDATLEALTSGDGVNSAEIYQLPPPGVGAMRRIVSTAVTSGQVYVGGFTGNLIAGIRMAPEILVSDVAGDAMQRNQIHIRATWRGDFTCIYPSWLVRLEGAS